MRKIILLCAQGMSTGMLVNKMREAATKIGYECTIEAHSVAQAVEYGSDADIVLIGPQVRYELEGVKKLLPNKLVEVIDMRYYGRLDGEKVLEFAKEILGDK